MDYVEAVLEKEISLRCTTAALKQQLLSLGAIAKEQDVFSLSYGSKDELALALTKLQKLQVPFVGAGPGWHPAAVFTHLRDNGLVQNGIKTISWYGPNQPFFGEA